MVRVLYAIFFLKKKIKIKNQLNCEGQNYECTTYFSVAVKYDRKDGVIRMQGTKAALEAAEAEIKNAEYLLAQGLPKKT